MGNSRPDDLPPHAQLIQMGRAHVVARTVYAAAKLGLADRLAAGPKSAAQLAGLCTYMRLHCTGLCVHWRAWAFSPSDRSAVLP
jgi:hypothetical protein